MSANESLLVQLLTEHRGKQRQSRSFCALAISLGLQLLCHGSSLLLLLALFSRLACSIVVVAAAFPFVCPSREQSEEEHSI